MDGFVGSEL